MKGRKATKDEQDWINKICDFGCIVCYNEGHGYSICCPHHIEGRTKPDAHFKTIPLCGYHHQIGGEGEALHHNKYRFGLNHGTEYELLEQMKGIING